MVNLTKLMLIASIVVGMSAEAVRFESRHFNNGGTMFSFDGEISPAFNKRTSKFSYLYGDPRAFDQMTGTGFWFGTLEQVLHARDEARTDERLRMRGVGDSYINVGVNQSITNKAGLYGSLGVAHVPEGGALLTGDAVFYHLDLGSLMFSANGRLPTSQVPTTSTYDVFDTSRTGGAVIASYTQIPNVDLQAYYSFADFPDMMNTGVKRGYGATASYYHSFAPRNNLTLNAGYGKVERRDDLSMNITARDNEAVMAGASYTYYNWTVAVDGGVAESDFHGNVIDKAKATSTGVRVNYAFTPRFSTHVFYGKKDTKSTEAEGVRLTFNRLLNTAFVEGRMPVINESQLFKTIKEDTYGVGMRYNYHRNVSFNGSISQSNTKYSLVDGDFAKLKNQNYRVGVTLSF